MGEVSPDLQQPSEWARIRGCVVVMPRAGGIEASFVSRPGAQPRKITAADVRAQLDGLDWGPVDLA